MNKLKEKLKDPGIQFQISFAVILIILWVLLTRPWEGLEFGL